MFRFIIDYCIKEGECYDEWILVSRNYENMSFQIQGIEFDKYYSTVSHDGSLRINIDIASMHRITTRILNVSNDLQNNAFKINERVCVSPPPNYLDGF